MIVSYPVMLHCLFLLMVCIPAAGFLFLPLCDELRDRFKPRTPLIFETQVQLIQCLAESVPLVLRKFG